VHKLDNCSGFIEDGEGLAPKATIQDIKQAQCDEEWHPKSIDETAARRPNARHEMR